MVRPQEPQLLKSERCGVRWCALNLVLTERIPSRSKLVVQRKVEDGADIAKVDTARVDRWAIGYQVLVKRIEPVHIYIIKLELPRTFRTEPPPNVGEGLGEFVLGVWFFAIIFIPLHHRNETSVGVTAWEDVVGNKVTNLCSGQASNVAQLHNSLVGFAEG